MYVVISWFLNLDQHFFPNLSLIQSFRQKQTATKQNSGPVTRRTPRITGSLTYRGQCDLSKGVADLKQRLSAPLTVFFNW